MLCITWVVDCNGALPTMIHDAKNTWSSRRLRGAGAPEVASKVPKEVDEPLITLEKDELPKRPPNPKEVEKDELPKRSPNPSGHEVQDQELSDLCTCIS